jgi:transcriptional regulator with XRE-family HTH domain
MKFCDVLKKERERRKLTVDDASSGLGLAAEAYEELEGGGSSVEEWAPRLAEIAIKLSTPTSRLISPTGKTAQAGQVAGQCGQLIRTHRERRGLSREELAAQLGWPVEQLVSVENGGSPLEQYAPIMLRFAEIIDQPIFNLFYPCGLPYGEITDYP